MFGCLYGLIRIGKMDHVDFLLAEIAENKLGFTLSESIEIVEALTVSPAFASMP